MVKIVARTREKHDGHVIDCIRAVPRVLISVFEFRA
jgi:hypothetical protein